MKLVIDVSYYQRNLSDYQWDLLATVIDGVIVRLSYGRSEDTRAKYLIETKIKPRGIPYTGYHWSDPTSNLNAQADWVLEMMDKFQTPSIYLDMEQYWRDWDAYMAQDLAKAYETRFTDEQLYSFYYLFSRAVSLGTFLPVDHYCADWFVNKYSPTMRGWVDLTPSYWEARYLRYYDPDILEHYYSVNGKPLPDIISIKDIADDSMLDHPRQFESYIEIEGLKENIGYHLDWNVFPDEDFYRMFGIDPNPAPEPHPQELDKCRHGHSGEWSPGANYEVEK